MLVVLTLAAVAAVLAALPAVLLETLLMAGPVALMVAVAAALLKAPPEALEALALYVSFGLARPANSHLLIRGMYNA